MIVTIAKGEEDLWTHRNGLRWAIDFLQLAQYWANQKSKDPSTKVGAVIARSDRTIVSMGYNGFPRGVNDSPSRYNDRNEKYPRVVHAEVNAILTAREPLHGHILYVTTCPCAECTKIIIQSGLGQIVTWTPSEELKSRAWWNFDLVEEMCAEAAVNILLIDPDVKYERTS